MTSRSGSGGETERASALAVQWASRYAGKVEVAPKVPVRDLSDFAIWYSPGVAAVSRVIELSPDLSFEYTGRWNTIAVVTDGSRVLGLGNVGPVAAMPVMEGKALIFKYLGGVDAIPLPVDVHEAEALANFICALEPAFGGINLEDIASPKCFYLLDELRKRMQVPVWHDDQQGTAGVALAGLINALRLTNRELRGTSMVFYGAGAANIAAVRLLIAAGADPGDLILVDTKGILHPEREDIDELLLKHQWKYELAIRTNGERRQGDLADGLRGADVLVAAATPGPNLVRREWIRTMARRSVVFALANPVPEIWPADAEAAGAAIVATGRSDFPNQVNNSLLFPSIFRGVLDVRARTVPDEVVIAAAEALAGFAERKGVSARYILPTMEEWEVYPEVATRVAEESIKRGVARRKLDREEIRERAESAIRRARDVMRTLVGAGLVAVPTERL